jgi:hypothetical protein
MLDNIEDNEEFSEAVTNIFVESMKAPGRNIHSKALSLFNALIQTVHVSGLSNARRC